MARMSEYYRGKRKKRNRILIPAAVLLGLLSLVVVLFYGMQKYAVITKDSVRIVPPSAQDADSGGEQGESEGRGELETTTAEIIFEEPDFSKVEARTGSGLEPMRAIFVKADEIYPEKIEEYAARLMVGNALVLEMKPKSGILKWDSKAWSARNFSLAGDPLSAEMRALLTRLKTPTESKPNGVYLVAQISICRDELYGSRSTVVTLRNDTGFNYMDEGGLWLDAYSLDLRDYTVSMVRELYDMGFDEVVLADVAHPVLPEGTTVQYCRDMSTTPGAVNAVCGFALSVANELEERDGKLSIYVDSTTALVGRDSANGQDGTLFFKLFDRVYFNTDRYAYTFNLADLQNRPIQGKYSERFVPVVINYLPDNPETISWVLIDTETH
ncbi:MAG: hypothetical protein IK149_09020 [Oscillospiraceae bacterium]|nr:hypothetical protein [Oscillospiraceae bacterium]